jgi:hypothetical protein
LQVETLQEKYFDWNAIGFLQLLHCFQMSFEVLPSVSSAIAGRV